MAFMLSMADVEKARSIAERYALAPWMLIFH